MNYIINTIPMNQLDAHHYVETECENSWNEVNAEKYGEWNLQDDDTKAAYYNEMWATLVEEVK